MPAINRVKNVWGELDPYGVLLSAYQAQGSDDVFIELTEPDTGEDELTSLHVEFTKDQAIALMAYLSEVTA